MKDKIARKVINEIAKDLRGFTLDAEVDWNSPNKPIKPANMSKIGIDGLLVKINSIEKRLERLEALIKKK